MTTTIIITDMTHVGAGR
ncbi:hypothetical protein L2O48_02585 [Vibrio anguillarum]|nr:hypothetical protein [Vibrio anguillarum]MCR9422899.1 hypothetical protein [Vibrio sp. RM-69-4]MCS0352598.1 hypothetical protein [Vibrio ordalii]UJQ42046.1 hypothetical protein L2O48_02585 [Vibrio anguillarum]